MDSIKELGRPIKLKPGTEKFSRLRPRQKIILKPKIDSGGVIEVRAAKVRGHHGIVTVGAEVSYLADEDRAS